MESIERYAPTGESPSPTMYDSSALWRCAAATSSWLKMLTVSIWSSWAARQMRMAISPRFAARTLLKGLSFCAQHRARAQPHRQRSERGAALRKMLRDALPERAHGVAAAAFATQRVRRCGGQIRGVGRTAAAASVRRRGVRSAALVRAVRKSPRDARAKRAWAAMLMLLYLGGGEDSSLPQAHSPKPRSGRARGSAPTRSRLCCSAHRPAAPAERPPSSHGHVAVGAARAAHGWKVAPGEQREG